MHCSSPAWTEWIPAMHPYGCAGLHEPEQSQRVKRHNSSLSCSTCDVSLVFGVPTPGQVNTQEPPCISGHCLAHTQKKSSSPGLCRYRNPKSSEIQQEFLALDMVYILEQAERPPKHCHLHHFLSMDLQVTRKELSACLRILFSPSFLAPCYSSF